MTYIAAYTGAYLAGFLSIGPPAGLGVADGALVTLLAKFQLADVGGASVLTVAARLWRTVLEVAPGIMVLAYSAIRRDTRLSNDAS